MSKFNIIFHNADYDGHGSAFLVYYFLTNIKKVDLKDIKFYPMTYDSDESILNDIEPKSLVYIVDYCPSEAKFKELLKTNDIIWYDHVPMDINKMKLVKDIKGVRTSQVSTIKIIYDALKLELSNQKDIIISDVADEIIDTLSNYDMHENNVKAISNGFSVEGLKFIETKKFEISKKLNLFINTCNHDVNTDEGRLFWTNLLEAGLLGGVSLTDAIDYGDRIYKYLEKYGINIEMD